MSVAKRGPLGVSQFFEVSAGAWGFFILLGLNTTKAARGRVSFTALGFRYYLTGVLFTVWRYAPFILTTTFLRVGCGKGADQFKRRGELESTLHFPEVFHESHRTKSTLGLLLEPFCPDESGFHCSGEFRPAFISLRKDSSVAGLSATLSQANHLKIFFLPP